MAETTRHRVAFIDCEDDPKWAGHVRFWQESFEHEYSWDVFRADTELPSDPSVYLFVIISGSHYSANDDLPWIKSLFDFIRTLHALNIRAIASCFGSQAAGRALGGEVRRNVAGDGKFVIGYEGLRVEGALATAAWARGVNIKEGDVLQVLESHGDCVAVAPPSSTPLLTSPTSPNEGWQCGSIVAIQSHPELSITATRDLILDPLITEGFLGPEYKADTEASFKEHSESSGPKTLLTLLEAYGRGDANA